MTLFEELCARPNGRRDLNREGVYLEASELVCRLLKKYKISRSELATRLGTTKSGVTQLLDGKNIQLKKLADMITAIDPTLDIRIRVAKGKP